MVLILENVIVTKNGIKINVYLNVKNYENNVCVTKIIYEILLYELVSMMNI